MTATPQSLANEIARLDGVMAIAQGGNRFFLYDPDGRGEKAQMFPMATILTSDAYDTHSNLDREGVFRINIGVDKETFLSLFGGRASQLDPRDFSVLDTILPHPDYGAQYFVCVLNPDETLGEVRRLLTIAHGVAAKRYRGGRDD